MSRIAYDPVKDRFANLIRNSRFLRSIFYNILDLFFLRSWYIRRCLKNCASYFDEKGRWNLLDAGSGFGQYDRFILNQFSNVAVTAVDVKDDYLEDCRHYFAKQVKENKIEFKKANLLSFEESKTFDLAICVDVLEHIEGDVQVMRNIHAAVNPGGYFIMHSPSIYSEEDAGDEESFVDEHARTGYSKQDINKKLEEAGFSPVEVAYTYGSSGHFAWQLLIKYPMLWMNKIKFWALPLMLIWYIFTLPIGLVLMKLDMMQENEKGTGIYVVARKEG